MFVSIVPRAMRISHPKNFSYVFVHPSHTFPECRCFAMVTLTHINIGVAPIGARGAWPPPVCFFF